MESIEVAKQYLAAWNRRDPAAIVALFGDGGTYADAVVPAPGLTGLAIGEYAAGLFAGFPDLSFTVPSITATGDGLVAVQWVMHGTNRGPMQGLPPTGRTVTVPGADFIRVEGEKIRSVQGYFDQKSFLEQAGLQVIVQPYSVGPFSFGTSALVKSGKSTKPGAFSLTWIDTRSAEEVTRVSEASQRVVGEMLHMSGFISWIGAIVGYRMYTITAWEDVASARQLLRSGSHKEAANQFFGPTLGAAVHTSVWAVDHQNPMWVRCTTCGGVVDYERADGTCRCGQPLPALPSYW